MCRYIDQTLKDVNNKFKNIKDFNNDDNADDAKREKIIVIVNSNQINQCSSSVNHVIKLATRGVASYLRILIDTY
jgi:hypothetical protein